MAKLSEDREGWKARVEERMKHLYEWESQKTPVFLGGGRGETEEE